MDCPEVHAAGNRSPSITPAHTRGSLHIRSQSHTLNRNDGTLPPVYNSSFHCYTTRLYLHASLISVQNTLLELLITCHLLLSSVMTVYLPSAILQSLTLCMSIFPHIAVYKSESPSVLYYSHWWRQPHGCWNVWHIPLIWLWSSVIE